MKTTIALLSLLLLAPNCQPTTEPATSPTPAPTAEPEKGCKEACEKMKSLACSDYSEDCIEVCDNAQKSQTIDLRPACRAEQKTCEDMDKNCPSRAVTTK